MLLIVIIEPRTTFSWESSEVSRSELHQPILRVIESSHTQGKGIERITMSVKTSEYACAKYIIVILIHVPVSALKLVQFSEMGQHWKRFVAKNATVHVMVRPIMTHEMMEKVPNMKILV